jgi:hypothetical protein
MGKMQPFESLHHDTQKIQVGIAGHCQTEWATCINAGRRKQHISEDSEISSDKENCPFHSILLNI